MALRFFLVFCFLFSSGALAKGFDNSYEILKGDIDNDGYLDLFVRKKAEFFILSIDISIPIAINPHVNGFLLKQNHDQKFNIISSLSEQQKNDVKNWSIARSSKIIGDFNADGITDLYLKDIDRDISGMEDYIIFSPIDPESYPSKLKEVNASYKKLFNEVYQGILNSNYFVENAPTKQVQTGTVPVRTNFYKTPEACLIAFRDCYYDIWYGGWVVQINDTKQLIPECIIYRCAVRLGVVVYIKRITYYEPVYENRPDLSGFESDALAFTSQLTQAKSAATAAARTPYVRDALRKFLRWVGFDYLIDIEVLFPQDTLPVNNDDVLRTVTGVIENICAFSTTNGCVEIWEDIVNSGYILDSEFSQEHNDIDGWMRVLPTVKAAESRRRKSTTRYHCTYSKTNRNNERYYGRTTARENESCETAVNRRDQQHSRNTSLFNQDKVWENAILDKSAIGVGGYSAIRGREQQLIDSHVRTDNVTEGLNSPRVKNKIRGVAKLNPLGCVYWLASTSLFPPAIGPYTGNLGFELCNDIPSSWQN